MWNNPFKSLLMKGRNGIELDIAVWYMRLGVPTSLTMNIDIDGIYMVQQASNSRASPVASQGIFSRVFITKLEYNFFFLIIIIHEFCNIEEFDLLL